MGECKEEGVKKDQNLTSKEDDLIQVPAKESQC
jgi:hypothetical protein